MGGFTGENREGHGGLAKEEVDDEGGGEGEGGNAKREVRIKEWSWGGGKEMPKMGILGKEEVRG